MGKPRGYGIDCTGLRGLCLLAEIEVGRTVGSTALGGRSDITRNRGYADVAHVRSARPTASPRGPGERAMATQTPELSSFRCDRRNRRSLRLAVRLRSLLHDHPGPVRPGADHATPAIGWRDWRCKTRRAPTGCSSSPRHRSYFSISPFTQYCGTVVTNVKGPSSDVTRERHGSAASYSVWKDTWADLI